MYIRRMDCFTTCTGSALGNISIMSNIVKTALFSVFDTGEKRSKQCSDISFMSANGGMSTENQTH
jgi:hypothetical protein